MITAAADTYNILTEWLNANLMRTYPFTQFGALQSGIPSSILIDAAIYVPPELESGYVYVSRFQILPESIMLYFGVCKQDIVYPDLWLVSIDKGVKIAASDAEIAAHTMGLGCTQALYKTIADNKQLSWFVQVAGQVTVGTTQNLPWQTQLQVYNDTPEVTRIHPHCVHNTGTTGVSAIVVDGVRLTGDVVIQAGPGISLAVDTATNTIQVSVDAVDTIPTEQQAVARLKQLLGNPILSINGKTPDAMGNFTVSGIDCTQVQTYAGGLTISNPCSKPCCGQSTASDLNTAISILQESRNTMNDHYISLSAAVNSMTSRLALLIQNLEK